MQQDQITIKPRILPRDVADVVLGLLVSVPTQVVPVFLFPTLAAFGAARAAGIATEPAWLLAAAVYLGVGLGVLSFVIWSLRIDREGIHFVRFFGRPRLLRWAEISAITETARREVVVGAWLWPTAMKHEMTPSMSALDHFRIQWQGGHYFFPPEDAARFLEAINRFRKPEIAS
jgi:hypothetical protein